MKKGRGAKKTNFGESSKLPDNLKFNCIITSPIEEQKEVLILSQDVYSTLNCTTSQLKMAACPHLATSLPNQTRFEIVIYHKANEIKPSELKRRKRTGDDTSKGPNSANHIASAIALKQIYGKAIIASEKPFDRKKLQEALQISYAIMTKNPGAYKSLLENKNNTEAMMDSYNDFRGSLGMKKVGLGDLSSLKDLKKKGLRVPIWEFENVESMWP